MGSVSALQRAVVGVNHLGGRCGGLGCGFGDPGNPVKEEFEWRKTRKTNLRLVDGGVLGGKDVGIGAPVSRLEGRRWSEPPYWVTGGHGRDGGSHRVDVGVALEWARRRKDVPRRPSGHPRGDTFECRCGTAYGCILCVPVPCLLCTADTPLLYFAACSCSIL